MVSLKFRIGIMLLCRRTGKSARSYHNFQCGWWL